MHRCVYVLYIVNETADQLTNFCLRAPTMASSLASKDIIGFARVGKTDSICRENMHK